MDDGERRTPTYFDVYNGSLIIGDPAYAEHIRIMEESGYPADVRPLEDVLNDDELVLPPGGFKSSINWPKETHNSHVANGLWLVHNANRKARGARFDADKDLLRMAGRLGLLASGRQITKSSRFGGLSEFYRQMGIDSKLAYQELLPQNALDYLINLSDQLGYVPTGPQLNKLSHEDRRKPSQHILINRIGMGLGNFALEYGYWAPQAFKNQDCIDFGLDFCLENNGLRPTLFETDSLYSPMRRGPSSTGIISRFGSVAGFFKVLRHNYTQVLDQRKEILYLAEEAKKTKPLSKVLTPGAPASSIITAYARYHLIRTLTPEVAEDEMPALCSADLDDSQLILSLKSHKREINAERLNQTSAEFGFPRSAWKSSSYRQRLNIENTVQALLERQRGPLTAKEEDIMQDSISAGVDFLFANPHLVKDRLFWRSWHFEMMRKKNIAPPYKLFKRLFVSRPYFGEIVYTRYHRQKAESEVSKTEVLAGIQAGLADNSLPAELFNGLKDYDEETKVTRFARFAVLTDLRQSGKLPTITDERILQLSALDNGRSFNEAVRAASNGDSLGANEVELTASMLRLVEFVYPAQRQKYLQRLTYRPKKPRR